MTSTPKILIAIDGFSSSGKSTMAKALARELNYKYVDTGAMYRAVTLLAMRNGLIKNNGEVDSTGLDSFLPKVEITFCRQSDGSQHTILNGEDVEEAIRKMDVSANVSAVAAIPSVRHRLTAVQQQMGRERGVVMDGRDIGTTVFPDAELKIYVNAPAATRAMRRFKELQEKNIPATYEEVLANVEHRDHIDQNRAESPLRRADDAVDLDNSNMSLEEQNEWLLNQARQAIQRKTMLLNEG